jgi:hypothetical protein
VTTTDITNDATARVAGCVSYLQQHGHAIGDAARAGDDLGKRIMAAYKAAHGSPEVGAVVVLEQAIAEHRTSRATPPYKLPEDDCDHGGKPEKLAEPKGAERCPDCGMTFRCCWGCSELAEGPVWHAEPMCGVQDEQTTGGADAPTTPGFNVFMVMATGPCQCAEVAEEDRPCLPCEAQAVLDQRGAS